MKPNNDVYNLRSVIVHSSNIYPNTLLGYLMCSNSKMFNIICGTGKVMLRVAHVSFPPFTLLCGLRDVDVACGSSLDPKDNDDLINSERPGRRVGDAVGANIINNYELKKVINITITHEEQGLI